MSDGVFGVLGGMALADLDRSNSQTAAHNREVAGMMEYQGNVAEATLDVARKTRGWAESTHKWAESIHKVAEVTLKQGKNNLEAIQTNRAEIKAVRGVADATKAVVDDTREGLRINLDVTKEARNNTRNLLDLVTDMHQSQTMMIDVLERVIKRDEALEKEVHELRDLVARSNCPSPD